MCTCFIRQGRGGAVGDLNSATIAMRYALFAVLSIMANVGAQKLTLMAYYGRYALAISMLVGTAVGLFLKYVLDKNWIFRYQHRGARHGMKVFTLYVTMGIATTLFFWSTEYFFEYLFGTEIMRYVGAVLGLMIGYITKYSLDKRFVFR